MHAASSRTLFWLAVLLLLSSPREARSDEIDPVGTPSQQKQEPTFKDQASKESPSFQEKKWTGTQGSYETSIEYDYVGNASTNLGNGQNGNLGEDYVDIRHQFMRHTLLAFLVEGGMEYQHMGFNAAPENLIPDRVDSLVADVGMDFRWSRKDLLHIEGRPGLYTDFEGGGWNDINCPLDIGYTRVVSNTFQWVAGFSLNTWRRSRYLGAAGFRWQINDRWKIKAYLPTPDVEYMVLPNLTVLLGGDIRGDSYRVGPHFGSDRGAPALNNALMDYQEIRVGPGLSWNIFPTVEVNMMAGYMVGRQFNYYNGGPTLNGSGSPFVNVSLHALFKLPGEPLIIPQSNRISIHDIFNYF